MNVLLTYQDIFNVNIGDYIQSLAAKQFFTDEEIECINRDELSQCDKQGKVIMNGWYTYKPKTWLPSNKLSPLFVSFHLNSAVKDEVLTQSTVDYLKANSPIGCRDSYTAQILNDKGIDAYFSSCLTTTLGYRIPIKEKGSDKSNDIVVIDPFSYMPSGKESLEIVKTFLQLCLNICPVIKLLKKYKCDNKYEIDVSKIGLGRLLILTKTYLLLKELLDEELIWKARYITHYHKHSEYSTDEERFLRAEYLLSIYSKAQYVITSRIHAAFPCLGLGTPVAYVRNLSDNETSSCRLTDIEDLLNVVDTKKGHVVSSFIKDKFSINTRFENKDFYREYRQILIEKCTRFFSKK